MGPRNGTVYNTYTYNASTFDPDGDQLYYKWNFGWGGSGWMGPYDSNETVEIEEQFNDECYGIYLIAKDTHHARSGWGFFKVNIPRDRRTYYNLFSRFFDMFPILQRIISYIL